MSHRLTTLLALGAALLLGACNQSVYYPLQPAVPLVSEARQTEVSASLDQNGFGVVRASGAPVNHLLLTGTVSGRFWGSQQFHEQRSGERQQRQWELGLGTFTHLGPRTTVGLLGGYGRGRSDYQEFKPDLSFSMWGGAGSKEYRRYEASTSRWYGQAYLTADLLPHDADLQLQLGLAYRLSLINYQRYSFQSTYYYSSSGSRTEEPGSSAVPAALWHSVAATSTLRLRAFPAVGLQTSLGLAYPQRARRSTEATNYDYLPEISHYGNWVQGSVGVAFYPHLLRRKAQ